MSITKYINRYVNLNWAGKKNISHVPIGNEETKKKRREYLNERTKEQLVEDYASIIELIGSYLLGQKDMKSYQEHLHSINEITNTLLPSMWNLLRHRNLLMRDVERFFETDQGKKIKRLEYENKKLIDVVKSCHEIIEKYYVPKEF